jgi:hypothetical protein
MTVQRICFVSYYYIRAAVRLYTGTGVDHRPIEDYVS